MPGRIQTCGLRLRKAVLFTRQILRSAVNGNPRLPARAQGRSDYLHRAPGPTSFRTRVSSAPQPAGINRHTPGYCKAETSAVSFAVSGSAPGSSAAPVPWLIKKRGGLRLEVFMGLSQYQTFLSEGVGPPDTQQWDGACEFAPSIYSTVTPAEALSSPSTLSAVTVAVMLTVPLLCPVTSAV